MVPIKKHDIVVSGILYDISRVNGRKHENLLQSLNVVYFRLCFVATIVLAMTLHELKRATR